MIFGMLYCYIKIQPRTPYLLRVIAMNALSIDLRQRILNYSLTHPIRQTAEVFQVSPDTVHRLKKLYYETGGVEPRPCQAEHWKAISEEGELYRFLFEDVCFETASWRQGANNGQPACALRENRGRIFK